MKVMIITIMMKLITSTILRLTKKKKTAVIQIVTLIMIMITKMIK